MKNRVTAIGNAGFQINIGSFTVFIDAFYTPMPDVGTPPAIRSAGVTKADLLLITHSHPDHFNLAEVEKVSRHTGALVGGPKTVVSQLMRFLPPERLLEIEPQSTGRGAQAQSRTLDEAGFKLTAFRTYHSTDHNSYLLEVDGFRIFHDGDNEDTTMLDPASLLPLDALFISAHDGSRWTDLVRKTSPRRWFLMHLTSNELDQHARRRLLPALTNDTPLPDAMSVLRPSESVSI